MASVLGRGLPLLTGHVGAYVYGGWYVDTDVLCARKLSELAALGEQELVLIEQPRTRKEKRRSIHSHR